MRAANEKARQDEGITSCGHTWQYVTPVRWRGKETGNETRATGKEAKADNR